jgi:hypothetical protein
MRKGKSGTSGLAERRRERGKGKLKADGRQMHTTNRKKMGGADPIGFLCDVLSNESAPDGERKEAAEEFLPYYHPQLAKMGPLLSRCLCDQRQ